MSTVISRRARLGLVLLGSLLALTLGLISGPASAQAATSNYCTGWLGGNGGCVGAARWLYQVYGWGDQAPVCVAANEGYAYSCSSAAGVGVYSPNHGTNWFKPVIVNGSLNSSNFVHGVALQP